MGSIASAIKQEVGAFFSLKEKSFKQC